MKGNKHYCLFVVTKTCRTVSYTMLAHAKWFAMKSAECVNVSPMNKIDGDNLSDLCITENNKPARKIIPLLFLFVGKCKNDK